MLSNKQRTTDSDQFQQNQQKESFPGIFKQKIKDFSQWPAEKQMLAVSAVGGIFFAALPLLLSTLPLAVIGAAVSLTLFLAVKAVSYLIEGIKWSAERVVDGAKYSAHNIQAGTIYAKDKVKEGYEYSVSTLSHVLEKGSTFLYRVSGKEDYLDKIKQLTPEQIAEFNDIRKEFRVIFDSPENNTRLIKNILSQIVEKIDAKIDSKTANETKDVDRWKGQKAFISNLNTEKLKSLLTGRSIPDNSCYMIHSIFSEHYNQIKEVIVECKETQTFQAAKREEKRQEKKAKRGRSSSQPSSQKEYPANIENADSHSSSNSYDSGKDSISLMDEIDETYNKIKAKGSSTPIDSLLSESDNSHDSDIDSLNSSFSEHFFDASEDSTYLPQTNLKDMNNAEGLTVGIVK